MAAANLGIAIWAGAWAAAPAVIAYHAWGAIGDLEAAGAHLTPMPLREARPELFEVLRRLCPMKSRCADPRHHNI